MIKKSLFLVSFAFWGAGVYAQEEVQAQPANDFLNSIGMNSAISARGETITETMKCADYLGFRWIRSGKPDGIQVRMVHLKNMYEKYGVRFNYLMSANGDQLDAYLESAKELIETVSPDVFLGFEGCNEPNNWGIKYQGEYGAGKYGNESAGPHSYKPLARYMRDLYAKAKADPILKNYPVWSSTDTGAAWENVGLHFLEIPEDAEGVDPEFPAGTKYADYACCHNYFSGVSARTNNQTWRASDPCGTTGNTLYANFGVTWRDKYKGYSNEELMNLPRVCTETGTTIDGLQVTEEYQGLTYLSCYLAQFKRGWKYTAMYILRDRTDEGGNQTFGFYSGDYKPRLAAHYLHNMTTILDDDRSIENPGTLAYTISPLPETTHDLLLQKNDGTMMLVIWSEKYARGSQPDEVTVTFGETMKKINVYNPAQYETNDPQIGERPVQTYENVSSIPLSMLDHPYIIEINPVETSVAETPTQDQTLFSCLNNPVSDVLSVKIGQPLSELAVFDLAGKCVLNWNNMQEGYHDLDVTAIRQGSYIVRATSQNETVESLYFIKQQ